LAWNHDRSWARSICKAGLFSAGGALEQAFWYQLFITDLAGLVDKLLQHHGHASQVISDALGRAKNFISIFSTKYDDVPAIGDSDCGYALSPLLSMSWPGEGAQKPLKIFPESGYSSIRDEDNRLIFDHGPLGMAPSCGHGHADALSIWLWVNGQEILRDSGTYTYTGEPAWREYFRSTGAHNTVSLSGRSQARMVAAFMWSTHYHAELASHSMHNDGSYVFLAWHDGYAHQGFTHWRGIVYRPGEGMLVWDFFAPTRAGLPEPVCTVHWHLAGSCKIIEDVCEVRVGDRVVCYIQSDQPKTLCYGASSPPNGWHSPTYGEKSAAYTLNIEGRGISDQGVTTLFSFHSTEYLDINYYQLGLKDIQGQLQKLQAQI